MHSTESICTFHACQALLAAALAATSGALIGIARETQELLLLCRHRTFEGVGTQIECIDVHRHEDVDEAGFLQSAKKRFGSKAGLVCKVILARCFYRLAVAVEY